VEWVDLTTIQFPVWRSFGTPYSYKFPAKEIIRLMFGLAYAETTLLSPAVPNQSATAAEGL